MNALLERDGKQPLVIAALHFPALPGSGHPDRESIKSLVEYALRNTEYAVRAGISALYFQDLGDHPWAHEVQPYTVATMSAIGAHIRKEFPELILGVCLMSHGARAPLAIAQAIGAQFVRLKVYVGAMVKMEGVLEGCAYEAVSYRNEIVAQNIAILADVFDRTGDSLGGMTLNEAVTSAVLFGRADGLILTGRSIEESKQMLSDVRALNLHVPLFLGGGANRDNIQQVLDHADGAIVSTAFKPAGGWNRNSLSSDWDQTIIEDFMQYVNRSPDA